MPEAIVLWLMIKAIGETWTVGIANPSDPNNSLFALSIGNDENIVRVAIINATILVKMD